MAQKIIYWLLVALIFSLGFGQLLRFNFFGLPLYLHDALVLVILIMFFISKKNFLNGLKGNRVLLLFLSGLVTGWIFALTKYSLTLLFLPSLYTLRLLSYLALFYGIKYSKIQLPFSLFLISGTITLLIGLVQYSYLPDMRPFQFLGWDDHLNRLTLPHYDPTFTGVMLSLFLLSLVKQISKFHFPVMILISLAILLTYSRSVWISLALTFGYFMVKHKQYKYLLVGVCLLVIPILFLPKKFGEGTNLLRTYSIESRFNSDLNYLQDFKFSLLTGRGLNTLMLENGAGERPNHATGPNNSYLYLLLTAGILGLVGWLNIWRDIYQHSLYKPLLIFFFIASLFNNVMFYPFTLLWILLLEANE